MLWRRVSQYFSRDMGIDLGTANTLVYVRGQGIVLREPSVVAIIKGTNDVKAVGNDAKQMLGRTPGNIVAIRPLKDGVIADFVVTESMLRYFIRKVHNRKWLTHPTVIIGIPSGITSVEKRAVRDSAIQAGAREVFLIEEPMAAAIGAGLPVAEAAGSMIIDIGGGTTEVAVVSLGGIVVKESVRIAGDELDEAIIVYIKRTYNLMIGERSAEDIKIRVGSAVPLENEEEIEIKGRDLISGLPNTIKIKSGEIRECLQEPIAAIVDAVKSTLERTPPELAADIMERGVAMVGGGSLLRGLDSLLAKETGLPVFVGEDPLTAVVLGTGKCLSSIDTLRDILQSASDY